MSVYYRHQAGRKSAASDGSHTVTTNETYKYEGVAQDVALADLETIGSKVRNAGRALATKAMQIGRYLNDVDSSCMALAAYNEIGARDFNSGEGTAKDGRKNAMSVFQATYLVDKKGNALLDPKRISEYRETARKFDGVEEAGVDATRVPLSTWKNVKGDADISVVADVVAALLADIDSAESDAKVGSNIPVDTFKAAGVDAGFVNTPNASGNKDISDVPAIVQALTGIQNALLGDDVKLANAGQRKQAQAVIDALTELLG